VTTSLLCKAIATRVLLEFDYHGAHRIVAPYCHGTSTKGSQVLRAVQLRRPGSSSPSGNYGLGKLWLVSKMENTKLTSERFAPDDPQYNPNDKGMTKIHCRVPALVGLRRSG